MHYYTEHFFQNFSIEYAIMAVDGLRARETRFQCVSVAPPKAALKLSLLHSIVFHMLLRGLPTSDAKKRLLIHEFFWYVYIIDIDVKVVRLNKYTLEIHLKIFLNLFWSLFIHENGSQTSVLKK